MSTNSFTLCLKWWGGVYLISISPNYMPPVVQYDIEGDFAIATWKNGNIAGHDAKGNQQLLLVQSQEAAKYSLQH